MMTQELDLEDPLAIVQRLNADGGATLIAALTDDEAQTLVDRLKAGADKYWAINPNRSLEMADIIIKIAEGRDNLSHKALGMMARGDALKLLGHSQEAWNALGDAGEIFLQLGDEIGWARTRIGLLSLCVHNNLVTEALKDGEGARVIFIQYNLYEFIMRLDINTAIVYNYLGDHQKALYRFELALGIARLPNANGHQFLSIILINMGVVYCDLLGDFRAAVKYFQGAFEVATKQGETKNVALAELNMAFVAMKQGHYPHALQLLYHARDIYNGENLFFAANHVNHEIVECYFCLNRFVEARDLAIQVISIYRKDDTTLVDEAHTLLHLATAEAAVNNLDAANNALNEAEGIFTVVGARTWIEITCLRRGQLALKQQNIVSARSFATSAAIFFESSKQYIHYASAILLQAQVFFISNDIEHAIVTVRLALKISRRLKMPLLSYSGYVLIGNIAEKQGDTLSAIRCYSIAISIIERMQQSLTTTLRSEFLGDKSEALQSLIAIYIQTGDSICAFETLERAKSQIFFNYVTNRQLLHWPKDDPKCQAMIQELEQLRGEHYWLYQKAHSEVKNKEPSENAISFEDTLKEIAIHEHQMRTLTEQLYLQSNGTAALLPSSTPLLRDIQKCLDEQTLLLEFYHDDENVWVFAIGTTTSIIHQIPASIAIIEHNLNMLHFNIDTTLSASTSMTQIPTLTKQAQFLLQHLYQQLFASIELRLRDYQRLIFVPYGSLHYVPFHLLFSETSYLIEHHEIVVLPAAGYVTRIGPSRTGGARVIAHSLHGTLPHAIDEVEFIHNLFGGTVCIEDNASRSAFQETPTQILHIATHAEYRQQQPDLSYIELADGQLFTDDLFQQDMSYELVTLSACETGRSHVASSDELIGLGRGFLYAGAGALVTSLWRVIDDVTPHLMEHFYRELYAGASKAAALRTAQLAILSENPQMHPAFWGAFQLVGDPRPLSSYPGTKNTH